ncbi:N-formylglutamate amidohydrolase [Paracoccus sp. DMF-8]|uniref:N-formylglutamate amidohydrolase n=1 Tax=Paracoccus sp. DMF-8 TaxID=3019445 RepID=UPI0023E760E2|nr:N-formylglutamate amidohydrolase [Paracoccus sp. DMF-8]MDF3605098.1 N-formylglutamate amidohydrolase [Paracoccus sp. DMF-8]
MRADEPVLDLIRPTGWRNGIIFASPHSGRSYPDWFLPKTRLDPLHLRSSEDAFVDRLIAPAVDHGAMVLTARVPRSVVDLNRAPEDMDPLVVEGAAPGKLNPRIMAGLGVIPRVVSQGRAIYDRPISRKDADSRIENLWRPYHAALSALIDEACARFGGAILIDTHSMPRDALAHLPMPRPEIVLGDRNGASASVRITQEVTSAILAEGFRMRRNSPFSGAYITAAYGQPARNVHVLQLEMDRSLYMDEKRIEPRADFDVFARRFAKLIARLATISPEDSRDLSVAAE